MSPDCPTGCATCTSSSSCQTCNSGYGLVSQLCQPCTSGKYSSGNLCVSKSISMLPLNEHFSFQIVQLGVQPAQVHQHVRLVQQDMDSQEHSVQLVVQLNTQIHLVNAQVYFFGSMHHLIPLTRLP